MNNEGHGRKWEDWQRLISAHQQSGLSLQAFCQKLGVRDGLFYCWRKRVLTEDQPARFALMATNGPVVSTPAPPALPLVLAPGASVWRFRRTQRRRRYGRCLDYLRDVL